MTRCHWCQKRASTTDNGGHPLCNKKCKLVPLSERPAKAKRRTTANRKVSLPAPRSSSFIIPDSPLGLVLRQLQTPGSKGGGSKGRWDGLIRLLKLIAGENEDLDAFVKRWDACKPAERLIVTPEDLLAEVGVAPARFLGALAEAAFTLGRDTSKVIAACAEPLVVQTMTAAAITPEGFQDRKLFLTSSGFSPSPQMNIGVTQDNRSVVVSSAIGSGFPDVSADALRFSEIVAGDRKRLVSPSEFVDTECSIPE
jgi:endogenous inhibitor of DNA gyrase (YacG/DUF329 family)